jgi:hypothetical protein
LVLLDSPPHWRSGASRGNPTSEVFLSTTRTPSIDAGDHCRRFTLPLTFESLINFEWFARSVQELKQDPVSQCVTMIGKEIPVTFPVVSSWVAIFHVSMYGAW